jgi:hypothetical protein
MLRRTVPNVIFAMAEFYAALEILSLPARIPPLRGNDVEGRAKRLFLSSITHASRHLKPGGLDGLQSFLDFPARGGKIGGRFLEVAMHAGQRQTLTDQMLPGRGKMGVGLVCGGKCRVLACVVHASHPQGHQTNTD